MEEHVDSWRESKGISWRARGTYAETTDAKRDWRENPPELSNPGLMHARMIRRCLIETTAVDQPARFRAPTRRTHIRGPVGVAPSGRTVPKIPLLKRTRGLPLTAFP